MGFFRIHFVQVCVMTAIGMRHKNWGGRGAPCLISIVRRARII